MSVDYLTKIASSMIKAPKKQQCTLEFRIKTILMRTHIGHANLSVRAYAIEAKI
jgi:hypothetical protein